MSKKEKAIIFIPNKLTPIKIVFYKSDKDDELAIKYQYDFKKNVEISTNEGTYKILKITHVNIFRGHTAITAVLKKCYEEI